MSKNWLSDSVQVFSAEEADEWNEIASKLHRDHGVEVAGVTLAMLPNDRDGHDFCVDLFNHWGTLTRAP